jgi:F-type H+-transporting ATPase subunit delta
MSYLAFQYAEALFSLALDEDVLDDVQQEFTNFLDALDNDVMHFLKHPKVTKNEKKAVLDQVVKQSVFRHFLYVVIDNSRMQYMTDMHQEFTSIVHNQQNHMEATVYSPKPLTKTELANLEASIGKKHNRDVTLTNVVDSSIVGGLRVEYEGHVLDQTINHYLTNLQGALTK